MLWNAENMTIVHETTVCQLTMSRERYKMYDLALGDYHEYEHP